MSSSSSSRSLPLNVVGFATKTNTHPKHLSPFLITVTVLAVTVTVILALYFLIRYRNCFLRRRISPSPAVTASVLPSTNRASRQEISIQVTAAAVNSLPLFTFSSITRRDSASGNGGDCAVCLSKFEQSDILRLLPLCCHAFHRDCIDTWLRSNLTCPLCRSAVFAYESEVMKILRLPSTSSTRGNSFRLEIGNISNRENAAVGETTHSRMTSSRRSYSVGSFEYFVDEEAEITLTDSHGRNFSDEKEDTAPAEFPPGSEPSIAGEVASGRSWLKDYVDQLSGSLSLSRTMSFRSSGRFFFAGSSRRSDVVFGDYGVEVETNRAGEEISEMFRWLSGV
ncbi:hypothetical protein RIF29_09261 [Crotalaria pallida]|uniref:RING-type E3 ubiquitin transferase n=1 Tax=Crotalaria pallida TaxID=3830 RepID=A0AAN9FRR2_CROPI